MFCTAYTAANEVRKIQKDTHTQQICMERKKKENKKPPPTKSISLICTASTISLTTYFFIQCNNLGFVYFSFNFPRICKCVTQS